MGPAFVPRCGTIGAAGEDHDDFTAFEDEDDDENDKDFPFLLLKNGWNKQALCLIVLGHVSSLY